MGRSAIAVIIVSVRARFSSLTVPRQRASAAVKQQDRRHDAQWSGVRDIVRVLRVSSATVINVLKKKEPACQAGE